MAGITVTPITTVTITAWQITETGAADLVTALSTIATVGYRGTALCYPDATTQAATWLLTVSRSGYPDQTAVMGDWIVWDGTTAILVTAAVFPTIYQQTAGS